MEILELLEERGYSHVAFERTWYLLIFRIFVGAEVIKEFALRPDVDLEMFRDMALSKWLYHQEKFGMKDVHSDIEEQKKINFGEELDD